MTSRERVLRAIAGKKTDRMPANYSAHKDVNERLMRRLGVVDYESLLRALGVDMRRIDCNYYFPDVDCGDGYWRNMWGVLSRRGDFNDNKPNWISPFSEETTVDDVHAHRWPDPEKLDYSEIKAECTKYAGQYALFGAPWSPFFHEVGWIIGQETFFVLMHTKPDVLEAIITHVVDYEIAAARKFFEAAGGMIDIAYYGNDFGTQRGLFISPEMWYKFMRPHLKKFYDISHEHGCKVMQHSCGSVRDIIPYLIEDGVDILDPIQIRAEGMELAGLQRDFGKRLCFHGGVDTQHTLPFGTVEDVRAQVRFYRELFLETGRYILVGSQEYISDIPTDNIIAIYEENMRCR